MSSKGTKRTAEANAKTSASMKAVWAARKAQKEHDAIHNVMPRNTHPKKLKPSLWEAFKQWLGGVL